VIQGSTCISAKIETSCAKRILDPAPKVRGKSIHYTARRWFSIVLQILRETTVKTFRCRSFLPKWRGTKHEQSLLASITVSASRNGFCLLPKLTSNTSKVLTNHAIIIKEILLLVFGQQYSILFGPVFEDLKFLESLQS
jgi:hypothetical protein